MSDEKGSGMSAFKCSVGRAIDEATPSEREIAHMILDDREGYDDYLLTQSLSEVLGEGVVMQEAFDHRRGDCACAELEAAA